MSKFKNKVALVTGAATGIGRSTALALAAKGAKVMVTDINEIQGKETLELIKEGNGEAEFFKLDVGNKKQIDNIITIISQKYGSLDLAVNNAGIGGSTGAFHEINEEDWYTMMNINLSGLFFCMQAELKQMVEQRGGRIVNIASLAGLGGMPYGAPYCAAKHGVIGLTKTAAMEYGKKNIRVNAICPGFTETPILKNVPEKILQMNIQYGVPMKRLGQPEEVADSICFLLSNESSYINGHSMVIDGGFKAG